MTFSTDCRSGIDDCATSARHVSQSSATEFTVTLYFFEKSYFLSTYALKSPARLAASASLNFSGPSGEE